MPPWFGEETGLGKPRPEGLRGARGAVVPRLRDQGFEERSVFARFGMPEDAQGEAAGQRELEKVQKKVPDAGPDKTLPVPPEPEK